MHVIQVATSLSSEASGITYVVMRLARSLANRGTTVDIMSTGAPAETHGSNLRAYVFPIDYAHVPVVKHLCLSRTLKSALEQSATDGAVLHGHGLWLMPNVYVAWTAVHHRCSLIVSTHGMLGSAALRFSRLKKKAFWALAQRRALETATCLHATSVQEYEEIRAFGLETPVAIIPNGVDVSGVVEAAHVSKRGVRTVLFLGRVHPKKGIDRLLQAWARVEAAKPDWRLRIVGPSEGGHGEDMRRLAATLGLARVHFEDGLFAAAKEAAYREADIFVLPTLNENFGLVVAEALANGTPVISTKGAPWQGIVDNDCGWWIDHGVEPLAEALSAAMAMPRAALDAMGARGRAWMMREFSWERAAAEMERVYRWCAGEGGRPEFVVSTKDRCDEKTAPWCV